MTGTGIVTIIARMHCALWVFQEADTVLIIMSNYDRDLSIFYKRLQKCHASIESIDNRTVLWSLSKLVACYYI